MADKSLQPKDQVSEVDQLRVNVYRLLGRALSASADQSFLEILRNINGDESELGAAFTAVALAAEKSSLEEFREEYQNLFVGLGRGELLPFGSYYLTGFLNEKPLARLRNDMNPLGIERNPDSVEPEDHAGALMDMMAGLIEGDFGTMQPIEIQKQFFEKHINNWMPHLFKDLQKAEGAIVFRPIGLVGELFLEIEENAFAM